MAQYGIVTAKDYKKLRIAHTSTERTPVKSLDFEHNGELVLYNTHDCLKILELTNAAVVKISASVKQGRVGLSKFYGSEHVVHSRVHNHQLSIVNYAKMTCVRNFPGHAKTVTSLEVTSELFASGSEDKTVRLWSPETEKYIRRMDFPSTPLIAFHPESYFATQNHIFAVAYNSNIIEIFTANNTKTSTNKFEFEKIDKVEWTSLKFSPDGAKLIVTTNSSLIKIIDAVTGQESMDLKNYNNIGGQHIGACFSPSSEFVIGGSLEGNVHVWNASTGVKECSLKNNLEGCCLKVIHNPKFMNLATTTPEVDGPGCSVHLWIEKD